MTTQLTEQVEPPPLRRVTGRDEIIAHALLTLTAVIWGSSFVGVKLVVGDIPPMLLGLLRAVIAGATLAAYTAAGGASLRVPRRDLGLLTLLGALGIGAYYVGINLGIHLTTATNAALLSLPFPALAAVGAWLLLGEPVGRRRAAGIALALAAAAFLTVQTATERAGGSLLGNLLLLSTTVAWTAYTLLGRRYFHRWPGTVATTYIMLSGAVALVPAAAVEAAILGPPRLTLQAVAVTLYLALICSAAAYLMWNRGLGVLGATRTSVYLYLLPVVAILLAIPLLHERLSPAAALGGLAVVAGTVLVARR